VQPAQLLRHGRDVIVVLPVDAGVVGQALHLRVRVAVQRDLMPRGLHLAIDVAEVGARVEQRRADGEEGQFDVLFLDDLQDLLRVLRVAVVDGEGEGVGPLAGEDELAGGQLVGDREARGDGGHDFDFREDEGVRFVEAFQGDADYAPEFDVEVRHWDVDVCRGGVARRFDGVPGLGVGVCGFVAGSVVLLQCDGEGVRAAVGDVEVGSLIASHVAAAAGYLRVE